MAIRIHYWSDDVERLLAHHVGILGFELTYRQPPESPANFCILELGEAQIMIAQTPGPKAVEGRNDGRLLETMIRRRGRPGPISVYIGIEDIDGLHDRVAAAGGEIIEPIWDTPWGLRQFSVLDPDGNATTFHAI